MWGGDKRRPQRPQLSKNQWLGLTGKTVGPEPGSTSAWGVRTSRLLTDLRKLAKWCGLILSCIESCTLCILFYRSIITAKSPLFEVQILLLSECGLLNFFISVAADGVRCGFTDFTVSVLKLSKAPLLCGSSAPKMVLFLGEQFSCLSRPNSSSSQFFVFFSRYLSICSSSVAVFMVFACM